MKNATGNFLAKMLNAFPNLSELRINLQRWQAHLDTDSPLDLDNTLTHLQRAYIVSLPAPILFDTETLGNKLPSLRFLTVPGGHIRNIPNIMTQVESLCLVLKKGASKLPFPRRFELATTFPYLRIIQLYLSSFPGTEDFSYSLQGFQTLKCMKLEFDMNRFAESIPDVLAACPDVVELSLKLPRHHYLNAEYLVSHDIPLTTHMA